MKAPILLAFAATMVATAWGATGGEDPLFPQRAGLVAELLDEGAFAEARAEAARIKAEFPDAVAASGDVRLALASGTLEGLEFAFRNAGDPGVYRLAGCAIHLMFAADPALAEGNAELAEDVAICEGSWLPGDFADARDLLGLKPPVKGGRGGVGGWLARRVVGFYRSFIGPAIGDRCVLEPSCSAYFIQSSRKHGILGVPMTADRFVREPVVSAPDRPWVKNAQGKWRHPDPVEDHDWWF